MENYQLFLFKSYMYMCWVYWLINKASWAKKKRKKNYPLQSLEGGLSKRQPRPQLLSLQTLCLDFNMQQYYLGGSLKTDR